jgi:hypothetical protein
MQGKKRKGGLIFAPHAQLRAKRGGDEIVRKDIKTRSSVVLNKLNIGIPDDE